jgi:hypothetical protein
VKSEFGLISAVRREFSPALAAAFLDPHLIGRENQTIVIGVADGCTRAAD